MGLYGTKGLYNGYKKNNKEREALDYYATPPAEVYNILDTLGLNLNGKTILEPCVGGGHMLEGIFRYIKENDQTPLRFFISDVKNRGNFPENDYSAFGDNGDFLKDDYPFNKIDYVIMNPPFTIVEPFVIRALEIAQEKLIMFGRIQFLEGKSRYENILKDNPPSDVYVYVDRVKCGKNGDFANTEAIQAYAWYVWDKKMVVECPNIHWIRRRND